MRTAVKCPFIPPNWPWTTFTAFSLPLSSKKGHIFESIQTVTRVPSSQSQGQTLNNQPRLLGHTWASPLPSLSAVGKTNNESTLAVQTRTRSLITTCFQYKLKHPNVTRRSFQLIWDGCLSLSSFLHAHTPLKCLQSPQPPRPLDSNSNCSGKSPTSCQASPPFIPFFSLPFLSHGDHCQHQDRMSAARRHAKRHPESQPAGGKHPCAQLD